MKTFFYIFKYNHKSNNITKTTSKDLNLRKTNKSKKQFQYVEIFFVFTKSTYSGKLRHNRTVAF